MIANPPLTDRADEDPATAPPATEPTEGPAPSRHADLQAAASRIRAARGLRLPVEQVLLVAAAILFPLGLIFILLGWEGASHTGRTYAQLDYLISGGIFGLGLSVAGGFMYFGYWLSRQLGEARRQTALTVQALQRLEGLLEAAVTPRMNGNGALRPAPAPIPARAPGAARAPATRSAGADARARSGRRGQAAADPDATGEMPAVGRSSLFATPRGTLLHRRDCPVVARRDDLKAVAPGTEGYGYCTMCDAAEAAAR